MADSYRQRFENVKRITQRITSSLDIGQVLEDVRDEARVIFPKSAETCLVICDIQAKDYMRPLHCGVYRDRISCRLCKQNRQAIQEAVDTRRRVEVTDQPGTKNHPGTCSEAAIPIYQDQEILAVLSIIADNGTRFGKRNITLLQDLSDVATNVIKNAKRHWTVSNEKMTADKILGHIKNSCLNR